MPITRRKLLELVSSSTFLLSAAPVARSLPELPADAPAVTFAQGVASGDPQPDAVMLWTRAEPVAATDGPVHLLLQLSTEEDFSSLVLQSALHTGADSDYTVRAYVDGLAPDTRYYYRFLGAAGSVSRTGRTRTAATPEQARRVNLAFVSCQSFENAHYGSWARMLAEDLTAPEEEQIHFVLHLGDFIYERSWPRLGDGSPQPRTLPPFPDGANTAGNRYAVSLADYRHLYRVYLSDPHLQEARARWPFICTWDDHEFSNDNFQSYSNYERGQRLEPRRKLWSNQAWFEYIPAVLSELGDQPAHDFRPTELGPDQDSHNRTAVDSLRIYRKLRWGKNLDLVLTDLRSYRSPPCLPEDFAASLGLPLNTVRLVEIADGGREYNNGNPPDILPYGDGAAPNLAKYRAPGSMLGKEQRDWFLEALEASDARWKLWGNALPLIPMRLDLSSLPLTVYEDSIFNVDSWAGYPHELRYLMQQLRERGIAGVVSLSGDHHMHGAGTVGQAIDDQQAQAVAVDFNVAGISSSPLFGDIEAVAREQYNAFRNLVYREVDGELEPVWNMSMLEGAFAAYTYSKTGLAGLARWLGPNDANRGLCYVDSMANGYGLASFDADELQVRLITMEDCRPDFEQAPPIRHVARFHLPRWQAGEAPLLEGPEFDGGAPFPFKPPAV